MLAPPRHIQQGGANPKLLIYSSYRRSHRDIQTNMSALFPVAPSEMSGPLYSWDRNSSRFQSQALFDIQMKYAAQRGREGGQTI